MHEATPLGAPLSCRGAMAEWGARCKHRQGKCLVSQLTDGGSLHDELNGTDEEAKELQEKVLLLLLHLVETILAASLGNLLLGETDAGVGLEHVLRNDAPGAGSDLLFFFKLDTRWVSRRSLIDRLVKLPRPTPTPPKPRPKRPGGGRNGARCALGETGVGGKLTMPWPSLDSRSSMRASMSSSSSSSSTTFCLGGAAW